jgi:hypothetical protein
MKSEKVRSNETKAESDKEKRERVKKGGEEINK